MGGLPFQSIIPKIMAKKISKPVVKPAKAGANGKTKVTSEPAIKAAAGKPKPSIEAKTSNQSKPKSPAPVKQAASPKKSASPKASTAPTGKSADKKVADTISKSVKPAPKKTTSKSAEPADKAPAAKAKTTPAAKEATKPAKTAAAPKAVKAEKAEKVVKATKAKAAPEAAAPAAKAPVAKEAAAPKAVEVKVEKKAPAAKETAKPAKTTKAPAAVAPAPAPTPLPKVTKTIDLAANEIVIKQIFNPKKMPPFFKKQQQRLIELRSALLDSLDDVTKEAIRTRPEGGDVGGMHMGDAGSDAYDRDFALSMLSKEQDALYEINEALKRLDSGVYGVCELSGQRINEERLEALPYTRYTRDMQEQIERDQMGGRFRRPVVRSVFGLDEDGDDDDDDDDEGGSGNSGVSNDSSLDFGKE